MPCRLRKKAENTVRLLYESQSWEYTSFLTLTFEDECLNPNYSLDRETMPLFNKRLRKILSEDGRKMKFFYNGEYGDEYSRPHHHGIYFGIDPYKDQQKIEDAWGMGFVEVSEANPNSMDYVCGYVQKKIYGDLVEEFYGGRLPPFHQLSQGIGLDFARENLEQIERNGYITRNGVKMPVPQYFKRKLRINASDAHLRAEEEFQSYQEFYKTMGLTFYDEKAQKHRIDEAKQVDLNLKAKIDLRQQKRADNGRSL